MIQYIRERYGEVYQVRTFGYMAEAGALRRAGQALGIESKEIDLISKGEKEPSKELTSLAKKLEGVLQNFSCHASAVIIMNDDPSNFCAIERQVDAEGNIRHVVAYDFHDMEKMGILKQDILGLITLDVIEDTCKAVNLDITTIPLNDSMTVGMLCRGDTAGCFQIETPGMTKTILELKPERYRDLIPLVALYRPGPKDAKLEGTNYTMLDVFLRCRSGLQEVEYLHPKLEPILKDTYGIILYQEQIQQIARDLCGYTLGEGDLLRRAVGRKEKETMDKIIPEFISRGVQNGIPEDVMHKIADLVVTFARYGFNMGHSAAYGLTAYQTAYLKAHYSTEFMCALLNSKIGDTDKTAWYVDECRNLGIELLPPSIQYSDRRWKIENGKLRMGLSCIKGVGKAPFESVHNFADFMYKNTSLNKDTTAALIKAGAFGEDKGLLLAQLEWFKDDKKGYKRKLECLANIERYSQLGKEKQVEQWRQKLAQVIPFENVYQLEVDSLMLEQDVLGFTFDEKLSHYDLSYCNGVSVIGGEVLRFKKLKDKNKNNMAFVDIRTPSGDKNLVMFSRNYKELKQGRVYLFQVRDGKIDQVAEAKKL